MANNTRLNALLRVYYVDAQTERRKVVQQGLAELKALYPTLDTDGWTPFKYSIVEALGQAEAHGGHIPASTPFLGETMEGRVTRDATLTLPPFEPGVRWQASAPEPAPSLVTAAFIARHTGSGGVG